MRLGFLASHSGSGMRAILAAIDSGRLRAEPAIVIGNNKDATALEFAREAGIPTRHISSAALGSPAAQPLSGEAAAEATDAAIAAALINAGVNLVILSGYMRPLGPQTLRAFQGRVLNIHPALLPKYGGQGMYGSHVHRAVVAAGDTESGATIHLVDEIYDHGAILAQRKVPVEPGDTPEMVESKVRAIEPGLYVDTLAAILAGDFPSYAFSTLSLHRPAPPPGHPTTVC